MADVSLMPNSKVPSVAADLDAHLTQVQIDKFTGSVAHSRQDDLAVEEPLQIRLSYKSDGVRTEKDCAITMRTPGHDSELAAGFLFSENILESADQIVRVRQRCGVAKNGGSCNRVVFELTPDARFDPKRLERHFYVSSSCGVCGKASIESLRSSIRFAISPLHPSLDPSLICQLPETLRKFQSVFQKTGGLHAAALFDSSGTLLSVREDVGRHNAVDKLIGAEFLRANLPLQDKVMLLSGRASFELIQKGLMAGIPIAIAVGAPSSLAVEMAQRFKMTLIGFVRGNQFNVYSGVSRLRNPV